MNSIRNMFKGKKYPRPKNKEKIREIDILLVPLS